MRGQYKAITKLGADVVAIGTGNLVMAKAFVEDEKIPFRVLLDEDGEAANAAGLTSAGLGSLFKPGLWKNAMGAYKQGHRQTKLGPRSMQLGGTFILAPKGKVYLAHLDADPSDHASVDVVLKALKDAAATA